MGPLDRILALTETVEQHVERGDWTEAGILDAERCRLLAELFADPASKADLAAYRGVLEQLLLRNAQTIQRVEARQREIARESVLLQRAGNAAHAYRSNTGSHNVVQLHPAGVNADERTKQQ